MKAYLKIVQISGAPDNEYYRDSRIVAVSIAPDLQKRSVFQVPLKGLESLETDQLWIFDVENYEMQSLSVTISETRPDRVQLARVNLPLCWFPLDKQVNESYPMRPLVLGIAPLVALIDVHISTDPRVQPFKVGFSGLLFEPGWRPPNNKNIGPPIDNSGKPAQVKKRLLKLNPKNSIDSNQTRPDNDSNDHNDTENINNNNSYNNATKQDDKSDDESIQIDLSSSSSSDNEGDDDDDDDDDDDYSSDDEGNEDNENRKPMQNFYFAPGGNLFPVATFSIEPTRKLPNQKGKRKRHRHHHHGHHRHRHHHSHHDKQSHSSNKNSHKQASPNDRRHSSEKKHCKSSRPKELQPSQTFNRDTANVMTVLSSLQLQQFKDTPVISSGSNLTKDKLPEKPKRMLRENVTGLSTSKKKTMENLYK
ncbi:hypothetical protein TRFO_14468 [Tritrichomonas foetus]|uniref:Uncharacterized protein n=1 Tax=Tritrichomonas foetus TaxID=1144522 RepID=A0A1J4KZT8_9EUKA|nr:hypothetical protein TRFO_14468 [Tritrichomonas foetus]|eukprot:OHT15109.1 hypothetical protein TRFO_14468 [Tritrichomonas foetus]